MCSKVDFWDSYKYPDGHSPPKTMINIIRKNLYIHVYSDSFNTYSYSKVLSHPKFSTFMNKWNYVSEYLIVFYSNIFTAHSSVWMFTLMLWDLISISFQCNVHVICIMAVLKIQQDLLNFIVLVDLHIEMADKHINK